MPLAELLLAGVASPCAAGLWGEVESCPKPPVPCQLTEQQNGGS